MIIKSSLSGRMLMQKRYIFQALLIFLFFRSLKAGSFLAAISKSTGRIGFFVGVDITPVLLVLLLNPGESSSPSLFLKLLEFSIFS